MPNLKTFLNLENGALLENLVKIINVPKLKSKSQKVYIFLKIVQKSAYLYFKTISLFFSFVIFE